VRGVTRADTRSPARALSDEAALLLQQQKKHTPVKECGVVSASTSAVAPSSVALSAAASVEVAASRTGTPSPPFALPQLHPSCCSSSITQSFVLYQLRTESLTDI